MTNISDLAQRIALVVDGLYAKLSGASEPGYDDHKELIAHAADNFLERQREIGTREARRESVALAVANMLASGKRPTE